MTLWTELPDRQADTCLGFTQFPSLLLKLLQNGTEPIPQVAPTSEKQAFHRANRNIHRFCRVRTTVSLLIAQRDSGTLPIRQTTHGSQNCLANLPASQLGVRTRARIGLLFNQVD